MPHYWRASCQSTSKKSGVSSTQPDQLKGDSTIPTILASLGSPFRYGSYKLGNTADRLESRAGKWIQHEHTFPYKIMKHKYINAISASTYRLRTTLQPPHFGEQTRPQVYFCQRVMYAGKELFSSKMGGRRGAPQGSGAAGRAFGRTMQPRIPKPSTNR